MLNATIPSLMIRLQIRKQNTVEHELWKSINNSRSCWKTQYS